MVDVIVWDEQGLCDPDRPSPEQVRRNRFPIHFKFAFGVGAVVPLSPVLKKCRAGKMVVEFSSATSFGRLAIRAGLLGWRSSKLN